MVASSPLLVMFPFWWHYHNDSSLPMVTLLSLGNVPPLVTLSQWQFPSHGDVTLCNDSSLLMVASSPLLVMFPFWWHYHSDNSLPMVTSLSLGNVPAMVTLSQWQFLSYCDITLCNDSSLPMVASSPLLVMFLYWWHYHSDSSLPIVMSLSLGNVPPLVTLSQWQFPSYGDVTFSW